MSPQMFNMHHNPNLVAHLGNTNLLQDSLVAVEECVPVNIVLCELLAIFSAIDEFQPVPHGGLVPLLDAVDVPGEG
jgi:hypothetical protein